MRQIFILFLLLLSVAASAQSERSLIRQGNKQYNEGKFNEAENSYRGAISKKSNSFEAVFNTANSLYKQGKFTDAAVMYDSLTKWKNPQDLQSKLYYNMGNSYVKAKKLNEGISAYKNSLKLNPKDENAKYNLSYAYKLLKKEQDQQKNQNKNNDKNKDNKNNKDNKKDQNKDNKDNKDNKNKDNKDNKDKDNKDQQNQPQNQDQKKQDKKDGGGQQISPEAAKQMLEAIQNDEKNLQKKLEEQKKQGQKVPVSKNW